MAAANVGFNELLMAMLMGDAGDPIAAIITTTTITTTLDTPLDPHQSPSLPLDHARILLGLHPLSVFRRAMEVWDTDEEYY